MGDAGDVCTPRGVLLLAQRTSADLSATSRDAFATSFFAAATLRGGAAPPEAALAAALAAALDGDATFTPAPAGAITPLRLVLAAPRAPSRLAPAAAAPRVLLVHSHAARTDGRLRAALAAALSAAAAYSPAAAAVVLGGAGATHDAILHGASAAPLQSLTLRDILDCALFPDGWVWIALRRVGGGGE